jgi:small nuclear ribonucleoprotein (snRNP)-like protein
MHPLLHCEKTLISFDQFGNLVLRDAVDRQIVRVPESDDDDSSRCRHYYADLPLDGFYIARGESLVLVGQVTDDASHLLQAVSLEELGALSARALRPLEWDFDTDLIA